MILSRFHSMARRWLFLAMLLGGAVALRANPVTLPAGFIEENVGSLWTEPVGVAFDPDPAAANRVYMWERAGRVWVLINNLNSWVPVLDIRDEVGAWNDYGMLGFALDPDFQKNGYIYVSYVVDHYHLLHASDPDYDATKNEYYRATIGRVTRYKVNPASATPQADPASRKVLIGETIGTGIPIASTTHGTGALAFGSDGTLLVSCGEGAGWDGTDDGGADNVSTAPQALAEGIIRSKEDVGAFRAQMVDSLSGKVLRIDPATGDGIPSNPFYDAQDPRAAHSRVWALGLRNPYRMTVRPDTGSHLPADANPGVIVLGDVGWETWEEVNVIDGPAQNCGWPLFEGLKATTGYPDSPAVNLDAPNPLGGYFRFGDLIVQETLGTPSWPNPKNTAQQVPASIPHFMHHRPVIDMGRDLNVNGPVRVGTFNGNAASETLVGAPGSPAAGSQFLANTSTGGVFYRGTDFPAEYQGAYFHADYGQGWIKAMVFDDHYRVTKVIDFATGGHPCFVGSNPHTGGIYYVDMTIPVVKRITYAPGGNKLPEAVAKASRNIGASPLAVTFSSAGSKDPEGNALTYKWDFGDGATSTAANPAHTFTATGTKRMDVKLTVTDPQGGEGTTIVPVYVNHTLPQVEILSPIAGTKYPLTANTEYRLKRRVSEVPGHPTTTRWNVYLHHETHEHAEPAMTTAEAIATISPVYSDTETFYYRVHLTVADDLGATVEREAMLYPNAADLAPQVTWSTATQVRQPGAGPLVLDAAANVSDADSKGLEAGELLVTSSQADALSVLPEGTALGQVSLDASSVLLSGVEIGTFNATPGTLKVTFNEASTPKAARSVLRRIAADFAAAGSRTITATLSDGDGATSAPATFIMNVTDTAPVTLTAAAMAGLQVPGEADGTTYASFGPPGTGGFTGSLKVGTKVTPALFGADGTLRGKVGGALPGLLGATFAKFNPPNGDATVATLTANVGGVTTVNDSVLLAGVTQGPLRIAAREGQAFTNNSALKIASFVAIDGNSAAAGAIFFTATLKGAGVTTASNSALCAALADGSVRLLARKTDPLGASSITVIGTLVASAGTLGEARWRIDANTIGARLSLADSTQAIYAIPASANSPADWSLWASTGANGSTLAGAKIRAFGLPGFAAAGVAASATLQTSTGGPTLADDRIVFALDANGSSLLAREGATVSAGKFVNFGDPVAGAASRAAFSATLTPPGSTTPASALWYADAATLKRLAQIGTPAPGGGKFASFGTLVLADGASGPAFTANLTLDSTAAITAANNFGLWAADSNGAVQLLLRTGQKAIVRGKQRIVKSFTALTAVPGTFGAGGSYDQTHYLLSVTFTDGAIAQITLPAP